MATELFDDSQIGTVIKLDKEKRLVGVYIPRFMPAMDSGEEINYKVPTNAGLEIKNIKTNISNIVNKVNYIWSKSYDYNEPLPEIGSKVLVSFIDNNPTLCYWMKFNANNDYKVIDEEKYKNLYNLKLGNKEFKVSEYDNIKIDLPEYFITQELEDSTEHQKHFKLKENYKFYFPYGIEESISKLQKSMEFLEKQYEVSFIEGLNNIKTIMKEDNTDLSNKLYPLFDKYRSNGIKKIQDSKDLAISNEEFKYYSKLLNGLLNTYYEYKNYKKKYLEAFPTEKPKQIPEENIDNKIIYLYENSEKLATKDNINDYIEYMEDLFSPVVSIIYKYWEDDQEINKEITYDVFTKLGDKILETNENFAPTVLYKAPLNDNENIIQAKFKFYRWRDADGNILNKDYIAMYDIAAFPEFYGIYYVLNDTDVGKFEIINKTDSKPIYDIRITWNNKEKVFNTIEEANKYLKNLQNTENFVINNFNINAKMSFEDTTIPEVILSWQYPA